MKKAMKTLKWALATIGGILLVTVFWVWPAWNQGDQQWNWGSCDHNGIPADYTGTYGHWHTMDRETTVPSNCNDSVTLNDTEGTSWVANELALSDVNFGTQSASAEIVIEPSICGYLEWILSLGSMSPSGVFSSYSYVEGNNTVTGGITNIIHATIPPTTENFVVPKNDHLAVHIKAWKTTGGGSVSLIPANTSLITGPSDPSYPGTEPTPTPTPTPSPTGGERWYWGRCSATSGIVTGNYIMESDNAYLSSDCLGSVLFGNPSDSTFWVAPTPAAQDINYGNNGTPFSGNIEVKPDFTGSFTWNLKVGSVSNTGIFTAYTEGSGQMETAVNDTQTITSDLPTRPDNFVVPKGYYLAVSFATEKTSGSGNIGLVMGNSHLTMPTSAPTYPGGQTYTIPTLSQWGLLIMAILIAVFSVSAIRRRMETGSE